MTVVAALWLLAAAMPALATTATPAEPHHRRAAPSAKPMRPAKVAGPVAQAPQTIPMDFSGMSRSVQDVTTPSYAHGNVGFPGAGGNAVTPGVVPSTGFRF